MLFRVTLGCAALLTLGLHAAQARVMAPGEQLAESSAASAAAVPARPGIGARAFPAGACTSASRGSMAVRAALMRGSGDVWKGFA